MPSDLAEQDQAILTRAVHLHRKGKGALTLNDQIQHAAHEHFGCLDSQASVADLGLCEAAQDRIGEALREAADLDPGDSYTGWELVHGRQAIVDLADGLLDGP